MATEILPAPMVGETPPARSARPGVGTTVLVLWVGHRPGPWVCRSLERQGYRVVRAHPEGAAGGHTPTRPAPLRYPSPTERPEGFLGFVEETCRRERPDAVLTLDEDIVRLLAESPVDLGGAALAGPDAGQYAALCDKGRLAEAARLAGVDHPRTVEAGEEAALGDLPPAPCIVKPRISGSSGLWEKPMLATTDAERDDAVRALLDAGVPALVQERLTGRRWVGHCVRGEGSFDFLCFLVDRDYPRRAGPASVMHSAPPPLEVIDGTLRLLDLVGYRGPCSLSFIEHDGRFVVHDVNLRLGATVEASIRAGFDIPGRSVEAALGRPVPPLPALRPVRYVRFDGELRELVRALRGGNGESPAKLGSWIAGGLVSRSTVLDPSPFDPSWAQSILAKRVGRYGAAARGARASEPSETGTASSTSSR
jgi:hypothetical protein